MTLSRNIYIAVLVIAISVLLWDKTTKQTTENEHPSKLSQAKHQPELPIKKHTPFTHSPIITKKYTTQTPPLNTLWQKAHHILTFSLDHTPTHPTRDLFSPTESLQDAPCISSKQNDSSEIIPEKINLPAITGIIIAPHKQCAMINDLVLFPGNYIGPYQIIQIKSDSVVLQSDEQLITLEFDR